MPMNQINIQKYLRDYKIKYYKEVSSLLYEDIKRNYASFLFVLKTIVYLFFSIFFFAG